MEIVKVNKADILKRIKVNRDQHRKIVEEAWTGYLKEVKEEAEKMVAIVREGKRVQYKLSLVMPVDHTADYDAAIDMLETSVDTIVELDQYEFRKYVRDEWEWQNQFIRSNARYSSTAMRLSE